MDHSKTYVISKKDRSTMDFDLQGAPRYTFKGDDDMQVSDGYHTMDELYEHRFVLFITLCRFVQQADEHAVLPIRVWRSKCHDDGKGIDGWFILGIGKEKGEIMTYHLPMNKWEETNFAETLDKAPEYDGHTSTDVLERLKTL